MSDFNNRYTPEEVFDKNKAVESVSKRKLVGKGFIVASCVIVLIMGILFLLSTIYSADGSFTVRIGDLEGEDAISLSETQGFANPTSRLSGIPMDGMTNITYEDLPLDELDTISGSHNGENYIAYTFYIGKKELLDESDIFSQEVLCRLIADIALKKRVKTFYVIDTRCKVRSMLFKHLHYSLT